MSILGTGGFPPALDGSFSVYLYGGSTASSASISQTGLVPAGAESLLFEAQNDGGVSGGALSVSLGGQNIPFFAVSTGSNYTLYGGNVSAYAGKSELLMFSALQGENNAWEIDDIQFSPMAAPEPGVLGLLGMGGLLFGLCRWKKIV